MEFNLKIPTFIIARAPHLGPTCPAWKRPNGSDYEVGTHFFWTVETMQKHQVTRHILGVCLLATVVVLWVASSFLMRSIFGQDKSYDKPFLVTYLNIGTFSLYLIPWTIRRYFSRRRSMQEEAKIKAIDREPLLEPVPSNTSSSTVTSESLSNSDDLSITLREPLTIRDTAQLGFAFSFLWFLANYFGNLSLSYTNVPSFTIISSLSGFFTLALGVLLHVERFTVLKLGALGMGLFGVFLVATQDTNPNTDHSSGPFEYITDLVIGDILALIGAALYGGYTVLLKVKVEHEERMSMTLFFGFVGTFTVLGLWPVVLVLDRLGFEKFEMPASRDIWIILLVNGFITFVSDYLWVLAMLMTSPLIVTVGISMV